MTNGVSEEPVRRRKFQPLKEYADKTMSFNQAKVMPATFRSGSDAMFLQTKLAMLAMNVPQAKHLDYMQNIGACSVFSVRWLSEVLGVYYGERLRQVGKAPVPEEVIMQSVMRNAMLKENTWTDLKKPLFSLHGLKEVGKLNHTVVTLPLITLRSGSFMIACGPGNAHAVAITEDFFFDPNVGEYRFLKLTTGYGRLMKKDFVTKWIEINGGLWTEFTCYQLARA